MIPRWVGSRVDPHDAYVGQFSPVFRADRVARNARFLLLDCLPRLVAGHRLPGLQAEPDPSTLEGGTPGASPARDVSWFSMAVPFVSLLLFGLAMGTLLVGGKEPDPARRTIRLGLLASSLAVLAGFLVHPSISNSDNYRYLVFLLIPWSTGFGLLMSRLASKGREGVGAAVVVALGFAFLMTVDSVRWYERLGWLDPAGRPIRREVREPAVAWLDDHLFVTTILGDYWDVYRVSFLTQGRVRAVPFPEYPDRFAGLKRGLPGARGSVVIVRPGPFGSYYRRRALAAGGREVSRGRGLSIVEWPGGLTP